MEEVTEEVVEVILFYILFLNYGVLIFVSAGGGFSRGGRGGGGGRGGFGGRGGGRGGFTDYGPPEHVKIVFILVI